ncbi:MAG: ATP-binding protein [Candidatus Limnocylindrales bacterium]
MTASSVSETTGAEGSETDEGPATRVDPSLRHLAGRMAIVEARVRILVAARRALDANPDDRFRGLYVSDAEAARLAGGRGPDPGDAPRSVPQAGQTDASSGGGVAAALAAVEADADAAEARGHSIRVRAISRAFGLTQLDEELLLIALAPDLDPRYERLYGYLNDDVSRRRASVGLALALCGASVTSGLGRSRLGIAGPLVAGGLVEIEDAGRPFLTRALRVKDRVVGFLLDDPTPETRLDGLLEEEASSRPRQFGANGADAAVPTAQSEMVAWLERSLRSGAGLAYVKDRVGSDGRRIALSGFARGGTHAIALDLEALPREPDIRAIAAAASLEAQLRGGGLVVGPLDLLADIGAWAVEAFADLPCPVALVGTRAWDPRWSKRLPLLLEAPQSTADERGDAWRESLKGLPEADELGAAVSAYPFHLSPPEIARAAGLARLSAAAAGRSVGVADLAAGVRAGNATGLQKLALRIEPRAGWADLILPPDIVAPLRDLSNRARYRDKVLDGWGLGDPNRGRGLTVLFTGDSGTGKTLSAEVVAGTLGLDLYLIDLSSVVDKYIGETEKNLDRVFNQADGVNGVLLFDEADAIFGKRSEVRDSRDRYANVEIAYLLQRMERFDGMAILTTNLRANLDEAFLRRLDVLVDFPMPDEAGRRRLWTRHLPPSLPVAEDVDLDFLAHNFRVSGGSIRNIVATAAYNAAAQGHQVTMADLILGTEREYRKLGHLSTEAEFGPYYHPVAS